MVDRLFLCCDLLLGSSLLCSGFGSSGFVYVTSTTALENSRWIVHSLPEAVFFAAGFFAAVLVAVFFAAGLAAVLVAGFAAALATVFAGLGAAALVAAGFLVTVFFTAGFLAAAVFLGGAFSLPAAGAFYS